MPIDLVDSEDSLFIASSFTRSKLTLFLHKITMTFFQREMSSILTVNLSMSCIDKLKNETEML